MWILLVLVSALFLAFRHVLSKKLYDKHEPVSVLFFVCLFIFLLSFVYYSSDLLLVTGSTLLLLVLKSLIITGSWYLLAKVYQEMEISVAEPLQNLSPLILLFLSFLFLGEMPTEMQFGGIFLLILGAYSLEMKTWKYYMQPLRSMKTRAHLYLLGCMIFTSISAVIDKVLLKTLSTGTVMIYFYGLCTLIYGVDLIARHRLQSAKELLVSSWWVVLLAAFAAFIADVTYFIAVALPATLISVIIPLRRTSTFFSTILGGGVFHEKHILHKAITSLFMIAGVALIVL